MRCTSLSVLAGILTLAFILPAQPCQLLELNPGASSATPRNVAGAFGYLSFSAFTSQTGSEVFRSDGTPAGTVIVADIASGVGSSNPDEFTACGRFVFFTAANLVPRAVSHHRWYQEKFDDYPARKAVIPFVLVMILGLALVMAFPQIALWLPQLHYGR